MTHQPPIIPDSWFRPRDEWDDDLPEGTWRADYLALVDRIDDVHASIRSAVAVLPWYQRPFVRLWYWWVRRDM